MFMCNDFLSYEYNEKKCCVVSKSDQPKFEYDDTTWENIIKQKMAEYKWLESETPRVRKAKKVRVPQKTRRNLFKARKGKKNRSKLSAALLPSSSSSEDPANSILSFTNSISADSNSLLKEDHKTPLPNLTNRRQNTKRKRNIKKCDGSKFRKMLKSGFL